MRVRAPASETGLPRARLKVQTDGVLGSLLPCVELDDGIVAALRARIVAGSRRPAGGLRMGSVFDFGDRSSGMYVYADIRN